MLRHSNAADFIQAAKKEIEKLQRRGTFKYVPLTDADADTTILPLICFFKYKSDPEGYIDLLKARICVRGDLQNKQEDTYAATLAARRFRALLAIAAAFDLEVRDYDAVSGFTNSKLKKKIYCHAPDGFKRTGQCWLLLGALYGLKESALLWYTDFSAALEELGLHPVPGVNCLYTNGWLTLFFCVDDIVTPCSTQGLAKLRRFKEALFDRFEMRSLGNIEWSLGIRVLRDRPN
jgi:Reverse transcriptase (RNA-dependent DNA polymerase)